MKTLFLRSLFFLLYFSSQSFAQLSRKQGSAQLGIRPMASLVSLGLPQSIPVSDGFSSSALSNIPKPFFPLPINFTVNKNGGTEAFGLVGTFGLGLNYQKLFRNNRLFRLEVGAHYTKSPHSYALDDNIKFFIKGKEASSWVNTISNTGFWGSLMYSSISKGRRGFGELRNYLELGVQTMNFQSKSMQDSDTWIFDGRGFTLQNTITNPNSYLFFVEIGKTYWRPADDGRALNFGIRFGIPYQAISETKFVGYAQNQPVAGQTLRENAGIISLQMSYELPVIQLQKARKPIAQSLCEIQRKVMIKKRFQIAQTTILLSLYDHENEDGDIVSVCWNGKYLIENYTLTKKPKVLELPMSPVGQNILTVYSVNTGTEGANTTAISFENGSKKEEILLYADKKYSEAIEFIRK